MEDLVLADYLAVARRWKNVFLTTAATLMAASLVVASTWSDYRSSAVIQLERAQISPAATSSDDGRAGDNETWANRRIGVLQQKVESTASLADLIARFNLYPRERQAEPIESVADMMRKKITIRLVGIDQTDPEAIRVAPADASAVAFTLSFDYGDALTAQKVTQALVARFIDQDLREKNADAEATAAFLDRQITALESAMAARARKIAAYEKKNGGNRPEDLAFNRQSVQTLTVGLQNLDAQIAQNQGNIGDLRAQLAVIPPYARATTDGEVLMTPQAQLKATQARYALLTAQYGPDYPDVVKTRRQIAALQAQAGSDVDVTAALQAQIADTRARLAAARSVYGDSHPDSVALRRQLASLQGQLARSVTPGSADQVVAADADNPAYLQIAVELRAAQEQRQALLGQRQALEQQREKYQRAILQNPDDQEEMAALTRDDDNARQRYRELKEKKMDADMDVQMQRESEGARLTLIDPPELPMATHPSRLLIFVAGFLLSLTGGVAAVGVTHYAGQRVVGVRHLETVAGVAPLAAIPHLVTRDDIARSWRRVAARKTDAARLVLMLRLGLGRAKPSREGA